MLVEQREVEVELAREVLVENRFRHPGPVGDLVHGRGVVAAGDEDGLGGLEQLGTALRARQPRAAGRGRVGRAHRSPRQCPSAAVMLRIGGSARRDRTRPLVSPGADAGRVAAACIVPAWAMPAAPAAGCRAGRRRADPLRAAPPAARGRRGGAAPAASRPGARRRGRRPGLPGAALPRGGGCGRPSASSTTTSSTRRTSSARSSTRRRRRAAQDGVGRRRRPRPQPRRRGGRAPGPAHRGHRPRRPRRLRRRPRRRRQLARPATSSATPAPGSACRTCGGRSTGSTDR